jgi:hypothetical protein
VRRTGQYHRRKEMRSNRSKEAHAYVGGGESVSLSTWSVVFALLHRLTAHTSQNDFNWFTNHNSYVASKEAHA